MSRPVIKAADLAFGQHVVLIEGHGIGRIRYSIQEVTVAAVLKTRVDFEYPNGHVVRYVIDRDGLVHYREGEDRYRGATAHLVDSPAHREALANNAREDTRSGLRRVVELTDPNKATIETLDEALVLIDAYRAMLIAEASE